MMKAAVDSIDLTSAFGNGEMIPSEYSCDVAEVSPPLAWSNVPVGTRSFVLLVDDADSFPSGFLHWLVFNIPGEARSLGEGASAAGGLPGGSVEGMNDFGTSGYGGPCPPVGTHRYHFRLYALDKTLNLDRRTTRRHLQREMDGHILGQGELIGRYGVQ